MRPKSIKQESSSRLVITWDDGHAGPISLATLRDACPCASCKGETVLFRTYIPPTADKEMPGRYELHAAEVVGNYALKLGWKDGHDLGIYNWEHLRSLCECEQCTQLRRSLSPEAAHG